MSGRLIAGGLCAAWCLAACPSFAWGIEGHEAVARLAEERLTPAAQAMVKRLLNGQSMASVATWADEVRNTTHPETYNWHFVDIPLSADRYDPARDCQPQPKGDCVVAALGRLEKQLGDTSAPAELRREALMFIIHFVGDMHQPLHAAEHNHDRGGNARVIEAVGGASTLHATWDYGIIRAMVYGVDALVARAKRAMSLEDQRAVEGGTFADWANESFWIARTEVYPQVDDGRLTEAERLRAMAVISQRIERGGIRLAAVLNRIVASSR